MVHPAEMHQLVDQDVIAYRSRHQHQTPVQANVAVTPAGAPSRPLIADADARHYDPVALRQFEQSRGEVPACLLSQRRLVFERTRCGVRTCSLSDYPIDVPLNERFGVAT